MERIWTTDLAGQVGERVLLAGWLHRLRRVGGLGFLLLRDGRGIAQAVAEEQALLEQLDRLHPESVLRVEGIVVAEPQAPGGLELREPAVEVLSQSASPLPFDLFRPAIKAQLPTVLDHAALALRHPRRRALFRLTAAAVEGFRETLRGLSFTEIQTPKIVGAATESGANVFALDCSGRPAYLAQSPQLYKQIMVGAFERVFEVGPVFRAEPHDAARHLSEYVSLDAEMGFIEDHRDVMAVVTEAVSGMLGGIREQAAETTRLLEIALPDVPRPTSAGWASGREASTAASSSSSRATLCRNAPSTPILSRATGATPTASTCSSGGLELVTGGERLHRYADYLRSLEERGLSAEPLAGYLEAVRHGMPPHGGFALGLERFFMQLAGLANVREATLFPRDQQRLAP